MHMDRFVIIAVEKELKAVLFENDGHLSKLTQVPLVYNFIFWERQDVAQSGERSA